MVWRRKQKGEPEDRSGMTVLFYAGKYFHHQWLVTGTPKQLNLLRDWAWDNRMWQRVKPDERWGSAMHDIEIITTQEARRRIRLMLSDENNWNVEGWGDWWPEKSKNSSI